MFQAIFDDCKALWSTVLICMAIDCCWVLVTAWLAVSEVSVAIWMIAVAQVIVLGVVVAGVVMATWWCIWGFQVWLRMLRGCCKLAWK